MIYWPHFKQLYLNSIINRLLKIVSGGCKISFAVCVVAPTISRMCPNARHFFLES